MMLRQNKSISAWQSGIMLFVLTFANKVIFLPSIIGKRSRVEAIFVLLLLIFFDIVLLFLFYYSKKKFSGKSVFEIIKTRFGNAFLLVFAVLCCVFFFSKSVVLFSFFQNFMRSVMYKNAATILFLVCVLPVAGFLTLSGIRVICRTMQLFFPLLAIGSLFCVIVGVFQLQGQSVLSSFSFSDFSLNVFKHIGAFGDGFVLFVLMDKISVKKRQWKVVFSLSILGEIFVFLICVIYLFSYPYTSFLHPFAIFELLSFVKEYNGLGRIDIIVVLLMMVYFYFQFSIYTTGFVLSLKNLCPIFDDNILILLFDVLFVIVVYFFVSNIQETLFFGEYIVPYVVLVPIILLPFLVFSAKKGDK